jgi:uncharacterized membrane protein YpjA
MIRLTHWLFEFILRTPIIFWCCVVANLIGAVWGAAVWYGPMLAASPLWAWPFIPDCPLAAFLGTIALFGMRAGRRWTLFYTLTAFACIHYGIWTLVFWLRQWTGSGVIDPFEMVLFVTHIGLLCEGGTVRHAPGRCIVSATTHCHWLVCPGIWRRLRVGVSPAAGEPRDVRFHHVVNGLRSQAG